MCYNPSSLPIWYLHPSDYALLSVSPVPIRHTDIILFSHEFYFPQYRTSRLLSPTTRLLCKYNCSPQSYHQWTLYFLHLCMFSLYEPTGFHHYIHNLSYIPKCCYQVFIPVGKSDLHDDCIKSHHNKKNLCLLPHNNRFLFCAPYPYYIYKNTFANTIFPVLFLVKVLHFH